MLDGKFPSDQIGIMFGLDGTEPEEVTKWNRQYKTSFPCRVAFAINQHYPELQSGYYRNKRLIALIQECLLDMEFHIIIEDNYRRNGIVPEEPLGCLDISDDYILIDQNMEIRGRLSLWESTGGKSQFYHDRLIVEVATDQKQGKMLSKIFVEKCRAKNIKTNIP